MSIREDYVAAFAPWLTAGHEALYPDPDLYPDTTLYPETDRPSDLEIYLTAIASMFDEVELYAADTDDDEGWTILFDPDRVPEAALPYLAQFVGERLPAGLSVEAQRQWIKDAPNQRRGTLASIVVAATRALVGDDPLVTVIERDGGPDKLSVITYTDQTPDPVAVLRELETVVPADISLTHSIADGQTWNQVAVFGTWDDVRDAHATWADLAAARSSGTYTR